MSPDQINIAIAEYCGLPIDICMCGDGPDAEIHSVACEYAHMFSPMADTPDYYHDLNAMHEAEGEIVGDAYLWAQYIDWLPAGHNKPRATAAQRAKAFLRTVGKWEGGE